MTALVAPITLQDIADANLPALETAFAQLLWIVGDWMRTEGYDTEGVENALFNEVYP